MQMKLITSIMSTVLMELKEKKISIYLLAVMLGSNVDQE